MGTVKLIAEKSVLTGIESRQGECGLVIQPFIMAGFYLAQEFRTDREPEVCPLILKGITAVKTDQSAFSVHAIKCPLRTVKDIHTVDVIGMEIECAPAQYRYAVDVYSHGRRIDTRADAAHIDRRCVTASVLGHDKRRNENGELPHVLHIETLQLSAVERGTAQRLPAKTESLLGLINNDHLINVIHSRSISSFDGIIRIRPHGKGRSHQKGNTPFEFEHKLLMLYNALVSAKVRRKKLMHNPYLLGI